MAFKRSVSTYFTNEKCFKDFDARAMARGETHSKSIMNMIEKTLQNEAYSPPQPSLIRGTTFPPFTSYTLLQLLPPLNPDFTFELEAKDKIEVKKRIFDRVDSAIKDALVHQLRTMYVPHDQKKFVMIKLGLDISYSFHKNENGSTRVMCHFSCIGIFFELTEALWNQWRGCYDLTNITYYKYLDMLQKFNKGQAYALIHETSRSPDNAGGFFIPVVPAGLNYPTVFDERVFPFIDTSEPISSGNPQGIYLHLTGVNINSNAARVKFTQVIPKNSGVDITPRTRIKTFNTRWQQ